MEESEQSREVHTKIKIARLYTTVFLVRRLFMIPIIVFMDEARYDFKIGMLIILQIFYVGFISFCRCFDSVKDRI